MKVIISIYKTNPDGSNSLYTVSQQNFYLSSHLDNPEFKHYGWKHEFPDESLLKDALNLIIEATQQT